MIGFSLPFPPISSTEGRNGDITTNGGRYQGMVCNIQHAEMQFCKPSGGFQTGAFVGDFGISLSRNIFNNGLSNMCGGNRPRT